MSNSSLVNSTMIINGHWNSRGGNAIDKIVIHHCAGVLDIESLYNIMANKEASATYGIGSDGRIAQYVDEAYRPWTTSSYEIDKRAVTIETSNSEVGGDWPVSDNVLARLIDLVTDICQRNGINPCTYTGDKDGVLQMHRWWASTSCPGDYLASKFGYIADEVNKRLNGDQPSPEPQPAGTTNHSIGEDVAFAQCYSSSNGAASIPASRMLKKHGTITKIMAGSAHPYLLDSGLCWVGDDDIINADSPTPVSNGSINVGDSVTVTNPVDYNGTSLSVSGSYDVMEVRGDRVVIGRNGVVTAAINIAYLSKDGEVSSAPAAAPVSIGVGSTVVVTNPVDYNGTSLAVSGTYQVMELIGDRAVIGRDGVVTAAINVNYLQLA